MSSVSEQPSIVLPLELSADEGRLSWNGTYYALSAALCLAGRAESLAQVETMRRDALLVVKLVPFRDKLRSKMFALLADEADTQAASAAMGAGGGIDASKPAWGAVLGLSIADGKITRIDDIRKAMPRAGALPGEEFDPTAAESVALPDADKESLRAVVQTHLEKVLMPYVRDPFASFAPGEVTGWEERIPRNRKTDALVPFQSVFPDSFPIDLAYEGGEYFLDDLYCTTPACPCTDVTCIVLKNDPRSGQNAAVAGFKFQVESGKVKAMSEFPGKFNPSEWLKRFSRAHPVSLDLVLTSRFAFMRKQYIAAAAARA